MAKNNLLVNFIQDIYFQLLKEMFAGVEILIHYVPRKTKTEAVD